MARKIENTSTRPWLILIVIFFMVGLSCAGLVGYRLGILPRYDHQQVFYAPIFSQDANFVYYLTRESSGFSWGPGWEFFSPPAKLLVIHDLFHLERTSLDGRRTDRLFTLDVPHTKKPQSRYRNRLFGLPYAELMWEARNLRFRVSVAADKDGQQSSSIRIASEGIWFEHNNEVTLLQEWKNDSRVFIPWNRHVLKGDWEVITVDGRVILLVDKEWQNKVVVRGLPAVEYKNMDFLNSLRKEKYSHRERIEKNELIRETHAKILEKYRAHGVSENEALILTGDEMERIGLYPKGPKIIANEAMVPYQGVPVFHISRREFFVGLFQDIDKAIKDPGAEVDFWGNYVRHRDFDTSKRLNDFLKKGGTEFLVETNGKLYLMNVVKN